MDSYGLFDFLFFSALSFLSSQTYHLIYTLIGQFAFFHSTAIYLEYEPTNTPRGSATSLARSSDRGPDFLITLTIPIICHR